MDSGGRQANISHSVKPQNLLDDMLIHSAPRADVNGQKIPTLGGIQLLAKIGQGGMGAVYYGIHPRLYQEVAVKVLPFHLAEQEPGLIQRFIREAQIAAKVRSPHLVGVIDVNEENGLFYLVMEFISGKSAGEYLRYILLTGEKGLSEKTALAICIGASEGLAAAHVHGVIHRDIKPDNIMIPRGTPTTRGAADHAKTLRPEDVPFDFGQAKLADLGLARNETGDVSMTGINVCMGTPGFMSPEQASDAKHASKPADVFSLGATLYALLAGDSPFKGSSLMQTLNSTVHTPHAPIHTIRPDISAKTAAVLDRCLAKAAADRYPDASAMLSALRHSLEALDPSLKTVVIGAPTTTFVSPNSSAAQVVLNSVTPVSPSAVPATQFPAQSSGKGFATAIALFILAATGTGGYLLWQKSQQDTLAAINAEKKIKVEQAERETVLAAQRLDDLRQAAFQEEQRMIEDWLLKLRTDDIKRQELSLKSKEETARIQAAFSVALSAAAEAKREDNLDKTIQILEDAFTALGIVPHASRPAGEFLLETAKKERAQAKDSFATAYKSALGFKREGNAERVIRTLDDALKLLGSQPHPNKLAAQSMLKDAKDDRERILRKEAVALDALPAALTAATEFKRVRKWDGVIKTLEEPLQAIGTQTSPIRATVEAMITEAKDQKERQRLFKIELDKANEMVRTQNYDGAKSAFDALKKTAQDPGEVSAVGDGLKRIADGAKRVKGTQARLLLSQGHSLRPDIKGNRDRDWNKAADVIRSAIVLFTELDDREDLAHAEVELGDCLRKDNNKLGDWEKAAGLYSSAALRFASLGDKKNQAEAVSKHAACLDPVLNTGGDVRQAAIYYGRAATLFGDTGNKRAMADNLSRQGFCISKEKLGGSFERAAEIYKRAAVMYDELGEKKEVGVCLFNQAAFLIKEKKANMTPEARVLFQRAAKISREAGDEAMAKKSEDLLK